MKTVLQWIGILIVYFAGGALAIELGRVKDFGEWTLIMIFVLLLGGIIDLINRSR